MNLIKEKQLMQQYAKNSHFCFDKIDGQKNSYYLSYAKSKHLDAVLTVYSSDEMNDLKKGLTAMWDDDKEAQDFIPVILASYYKLKDESPRQLEDVELYNYMM